jgi:hypothetical protein
MQTKTTTKRKPKPLELAQPPNIPAPREPIPVTRPLGELEALAANFQYLSDRVGHLATSGDLPPNAHEFITKTQIAINNLAGYTRKVKNRDLKEYREALANHQISLVCKFVFVGLMTVFFCGIVSSFQPQNNVQPNQKPVQSGVSPDVSSGSQLHPP